MKGMNGHWIALISFGNLAIVIVVHRQSSLATATLIPQLIDLAPELAWPTDRKA
jgi:hypothetical protein